ncbi:MAG: PTS sugar transporter subunit IIC [Candidatus Eisenbacteria bacterium]
MYSSELLVFCLACGVCALDTTAAWQVMLSQPLVSGSIAGSLVGLPHAGVLVGLVLQMLWSSAIPMGARPMPDSPVASFGGVWLAAQLVRGEPAVAFTSACLLGVLAALVIGLLGRETVMLEREGNRRLFRAMLSRFEKGENVDPAGLSAAGLTLAFVRGALLCLGASLALSLVAGALLKSTFLSERDYSRVLMVIEAMGAGVLFSVFVRRAKGRALSLVVGAVLAVLAGRLAG